MRNILRILLLTAVTMSVYAKDDGLNLVGPAYTGASAAIQQKAAEGVVRRLLGDKAAKFKVEIIEQEKGLDVFEVESVGDFIVLRGSSGTTACRGLKWYLNTLCHCSVSWRGDNLKLPSPLPRVEKKKREATPFEYRYIFNYCVFGYSFAHWKWPEWERTIDILALNGINLPLALLGQEKIWQETYREFGVAPKELEDFFSGPAWFPWQWMANLDGWGGPLPQHFIDGQYKLQKRLLSQMRSLGMKPILPGFSGHIPNALKDKYKDLKTHNVHWHGFTANLLDWEDPRFKQIATTFIKKQKEHYGTDHYYAIDPFNEMKPPTTDSRYISNMSRSIFSGIDSVDPIGTWVLMTWFCKSPENARIWNSATTKVFLDSVPDDRMLLLELHAECWRYTGWKGQNGWHGKPWVWNVIQNFGDVIDIYGGLTHIFNNYATMQASPIKGNPVGLGIAMEGLGYNPVVFELLFDMMWGEGVKDLDKWKRAYVKKRYGKDVLSAYKAWSILYANRYHLQYLPRGSAGLNWNFKFAPDRAPDATFVQAWKLLLEAADELGDCEAYHFDLVNVGREAMGSFGDHYSFLMKEPFDKKDVEAFRKAAANMIQFIKDYDRLLGSNEHFLFGTWLEDARSWGSTPEEKKLLEWGAKRQITDWGGNIGRYAHKEWSGLTLDFALPQWKRFLAERESELTGQPVKQAPFDYEVWTHTKSELPTEPQGNPVEISKELWNRYGSEMEAALKIRGIEARGETTPPGIAVNKPVSATSVWKTAKPEHAVDGSIANRNHNWAATKAASLTVDLGKVQNVLGFHVYPYYDGARYYQYTIEVSTDNKTWHPAVDMSENTKVASYSGHLHNFKVTMPTGFDCRYVRLNMLSMNNKVNSSIHVIEFKIFDGTEELWLAEGE